MKPVVLPVILKVYKNCLLVVSLLVFCYRPCLLNYGGRKKPPWLNVEYHIVFLVPHGASPPPLPMGAEGLAKLLELQKQA